MKNLRGLQQFAKHDGIPPARSRRKRGVPMSAQLIVNDSSAGSECHYCEQIRAGTLLPFADGKHRYVCDVCNEMAQNSAAQEEGVS